MTIRATQHVVYEVGQALHKVFSFTNKFPNPLQKWSHGTWAAQWIATEGEHVCQLYVSVIRQSKTSEIGREGTLSGDRYMRR